MEIKYNKIINEILSITYAVIAALLIRTFVIELFFVPTGSMEATILKNDYIFSTKYSYGYSNYSIPFSPNFFKGRILSQLPQRGDIVIFRPPHDMDIRYVKRLIGLPGDKIQLKNDIIYLNGEAIKHEPMGSFVDEENRTYKKYKETLPQGISYYAYIMENVVVDDKVSNTKEFIIPQDMYFFLGDNRYNSRDSRFELGLVPFKNFIAKARFIFFSTEKKLFSSNRPLLHFPITFWEWLCSIRFHRLFTNIYSL